MFLLPIPCKCLQSPDDLEAVTIMLCFAQPITRCMVYSLPNANVQYHVALLDYLSRISDTLYYTKADWYSMSDYLLDYDFCVYLNSSDVEFVWESIKYATSFRSMLSPTRQKFSITSRVYVVQTTSHLRFTYLYSVFNRSDSTLPAMEDMPIPTSTLDSLVIEVWEAYAWP